MFTGLTEGICDQVATLVVAPLIKILSDNGSIKRAYGHLIILNPLIPYEPKYHGPEEENFDELVLYRRDFGDRTRWEHQYDKVARSKAYTTWKTGLPSIQVQTQYPYLYQEGMTKHGGSAIAPGGLVDGFSGVEGYFDEMLSEIYLSGIRGFCRHGMPAVMGHPSISSENTSTRRCKSQHPNGPRLPQKIEVTGGSDILPTNIVDTVKSLLYNRPIRKFSWQKVKSQHP